MGGGAARAPRPSEDGMTMRRLAWVMRLATVAAVAVAACAGLGGYG